MARHVFTFSTTNAAASSTTARWRARRVDLSDFAGDPVLSRLKARPLEITRLGIALHRCDAVGSDTPPLAETLQLDLAPSSRTGLVLIAESRRSSRRLEVALIALEERRANGETGGMLVAITSNGGVFVLPPQTLAPSPVPLAIVDGPSWQPTTAYTKTPVSAVIPRTDGAGYLGFLIRNVGSQTLKGVVCYPESVGLPGVRWDSRVFEMDELPAGEEFFAAFPFDPSLAEEATGTVRLVGYSVGHDRTRFTQELSIVDPRRW